ncbi:MAG: hypothetical protein ACKVHE_14595 [Planctomycetales bacterium]
MKSLRDRLADGDAESFESLYGRCSASLFRFLVIEDGITRLSGGCFTGDFFAGYQVS